MEEKNTAMETGGFAEGFSAGRQPNAAAVRPAMPEQVQADLLAFAQAFPEAANDPRSIPQTVWDAVKGGMSLTAAYARYLVEAARQSAGAEAAAREQGLRNGLRSTGSMQSAGRNTLYDAFLEGWNE